MFPGLTEPAIGLITTVGYDYFKKKLAEHLRPNFEKIYEDALVELSKKHSGAKRYIKRFLSSSTVKSLLLDSKLPRKDKVERVISFGETIKMTSEAKIPVKNVVNDFYELFKTKIRLNPHLWNKIQEEYLSRIAELSIATKQRIDLLSEDFSKGKEQIINEIKNTRKEILKQIEDKAEFKIIKRKAPFPLIVCVTQFRVHRTPLSEVINNVNNFPFTSKETISELLKNDKKVVLSYIPKKDNNVIKLDYDGEPYKIIYPPFNKIEIWIEQKPAVDYLQVTIFSTEYRQINRLKHILFGSISESLITKSDFRGKMKLIARKFLVDISVFDYDPLIYKPVKVNGVEIKEIAKRTIMFGERGFLRRPELKRVVDKVKMEREKQDTDIYFIKIKDTLKLSDDPITIDLEYRGDLAGHFLRNKFTESQAKKIMCDFFEKFGNF